MKEHDDSEENEDDFDDVDVFQKYNSLNLLSRLFLNTLRLAFIFTFVYKNPQHTLQIIKAKKGETNHLEAKQNTEDLKKF